MSAKDFLKTKGMNSVRMTVPKEKPSSASKEDRQRGRVGRPCIDENKGKKRDYCKTINIAVPKEIIDQVNQYALPGRKISLTEYINILIVNDLEKNLDKYGKEIKRAVNFD